MFGDPTIADAVLDRPVHNAHRLALGAPFTLGRLPDQARHAPAGRRSKCKRVPTGSKIAPWPPWFNGNLNVHTRNYKLDEAASYDSSFKIAHLVKSLKAFNSAIVAGMSNSSPL